MTIKGFQGLRAVMGNKDRRSMLVVLGSSRSKINMKYSTYTLWKKVAMVDNGSVYQGSDSIKVSPSQR